MKNKLHLLLTIAVVFSSTLPFHSCTSEETPLSISSESCEIEDLTVILHAGGGADGLDYLNAQETFELYYSLGYRYFEYDLKLSTDGRLISSHSGEYLDCATPEQLTYEEFKALKLLNGYTPVNEEWLMQTIMEHPDVKIVVDAKMPDVAGDIAVLNRIETLKSIYNYDLSANIIPEIFSKEMWECVSKTTTFEQYFFSHYKVYYSVGMILDYFDDERIFGVAIPMWSDEDFLSQIYRLKEAGKKIFVFTPLTTQDVATAISFGADGIYVNTPDILSK